MRYLSVCSGIEAATVAWHDLGWQPAAFSEIEPFPSAVLKHHYPNVPNVGDMTKFKEWDIGTIDLLVGGTPCQSFSVAGLRKGLEDPRGNLALVYCGILDRFKPKWFVWENVPGVLSSSGGRDFGSFLGAVAELGYGFAYRVLDAQYFGVAQRRRRVFVVGCLGDWRSAAEVLFEPESLYGNPAPSREARQETPAGTPAGVDANGLQHTVGTLCADTHPGAYSGQDAYTGRLVPQAIALAENTIGRQPQNGGNGDGFTVGGPMYTLNATGVHGVAQPVYELHGQDSRVSELKDVCGTVSAAYGAGGGNIPVTIQPLVYDTTNITSPQNGSNPQPGDPCFTLAKGQHPPLLTQPIGGVDYENNAHLMNEPTGPLLKGSPTGGGRPLPALVYPMAVRRLTPVECERLQGFPDNYTNITWRKQPESPDGPRYKALGNSMAVPVMAWIGRRIANVA
jgi:DNA (cytosine-5)-methyltransferase 1